MIEIESSIEGKEITLYKMEQLLKPMGFVIGGNWDYDRGFFDYKMADDDGYQFLRIPITAVERQLDYPGVIVSIGRPFVLAHVYQADNDDHAQSGNMSAPFNQFAEPEDPDDKVDPKYITMGKNLIQSIEPLLEKK